MLGARGSLLDLSARALLRGGLVGAALAPVGLLLHAGLLGLTPAGAVREVVFDLSLGLFAVAPAALLEHLARDRSPPALAPIVAAALTAPLAALGAAGAFVQAQYAAAVLRTGSLDAGLAEVVEGARWLVTLRDLGWLIALIGLVVTRASTSRWPPGTWRPGRLLLELLWTLPLALVALIRVGLRGRQLLVSVAMLGALALALRLVPPVADDLAERARRRRERA